MGDLLGKRLSQSELHNNMLAPDPEQEEHRVTIDEKLPSFQLVVDNAHIHPKHAWATSQLHHHVSRTSSCPDIHSMLAAAAAAGAGGMSRRASSSGALCRWGTSAGAADTKMSRRSSTDSLCRWSGSSSDAAMARVSSTDSICRWGGGGGGSSVNTGGSGSDGALRPPTRRSRAASIDDSLHSTQSDGDNFGLFLDDDEEEEDFFFIDDDEEEEAGRKDFSFPATNMTNGLNSPPMSIAWKCGRSSTAA